MMQGKTLKTSTDGWITLHQYILMSIVALVPVKAEIMEPESCLSNNTAKLISSGIMSVLNFSYTPPAPLLVEYRKYPVRCGKKPNPTVMEVAKEPYFFYPDPYRYVTLTVLDIDPPSPELPIFRSILHLLLCNIPQNDIKKDPHRYVCLVFLQKALLPESICTPRRYNSTLDRYGVNITMILAELRLSFYDLYAINFFYLGKSLLT
ncbi:uncharacterized protein [Bemisia tabaci]|uniref:uncharacterized protein isoform X3 n=1 Tax=Bemisia tabaci TaxID=7038 RepID=UPI003B28D01E